MKVAVLVLLTLPTVLWSQEAPQTKGSQDLSLYVSPDFEGVTGDMLNLEAGYGYFLLEKLALRASIDIATIEDIAPGEKDYRFREIDLGIQYNFGTGRVIPYVGASLGFASLNYLDLSESSFVYGPDGGIEIFFTKKVALDFSVSFRTASKNVFVNDFVPEDSDLTYDVGLRVVF